MTICSFFLLSSHCMMSTPKTIGKTKQPKQINTILLVKSILTVLDLTFFQTKELIVYYCYNASIDLKDL